MFQDRLVKEMRLRKIGSIEEANSFLKEYLPIYNKRFSVPAGGYAHYQQYQQKEKVAPKEKELLLTVT